MRTSVGKLCKTKSGQSTQILTARKKWQLQNFAFLKAHIVPRSYTVETTSLEQTREQSENEESLHSIPISPASPSPFTSAAANKTKPPASKKSKIDDLLMKFLDRPRPEEVLSKQLETIAAAPAPPSPQPDERTAFSQWIAARMSGIPHDRWDDFQFAAMRLMLDYSRPRPNPDTSPSPPAQPRPPVQQQWPHFPQQRQQWGQTQTWQQQLPQRQQQWGASTQVQQPSQQVWQQPSSSSQPQIPLLDPPLHPPAAAQPVRQTPELGAPRSQSVPPLLDTSITGSGLTDLFMKQLTPGIPSGNTSQVAASKAASPSGTQEDSGDN